MRQILINNNIKSYHTSTYTYIDIDIYRQFRKGLNYSKAGIYIEIFEFLKLMHNY